MTRPVQTIACCLLLVAPASAQNQAERPALTPAQLERLTTDWASLGRYRDANAQLPPPQRGEHRVVFMGDSITDAWAKSFSKLFPGKPYIGRGISGQTTPQMLVRFRQDVIALRPEVVVILAGINDIAENTGPTTLEAIGDHLTSMVDLARVNGIRAVLASVTPAIDFPWRKGKAPAARIVALNRWIEQFAESRGLVYLDYYTALAGANGGMKDGLSSDGVHPTDAGYAVMAPLAERAITDALKRPIK
jgi:acyl-CoA thioesterase I